MGNRAELLARCSYLVKSSRPHLETPKLSPRHWVSKAGAHTLPFTGRVASGPAGDTDRESSNHETLQMDPRTARTCCASPGSLGLQTECSAAKQRLPFRRDLCVTGTPVYNVNRHGTGNVCSCPKLGQPFGLYAVEPREIATSTPEFLSAKMAALHG